MNIYDWLLAGFLVLYAIAFVYLFGKLKEGRKQLADGRRRLDEGAERLAEGSRKLSRLGPARFFLGIPAHIAYKVGRNKYNEGNCQYRNGKDEYEKGLKKYQFGRTIFWIINIVSIPMVVVFGVFAIQY